MKKDLKTILITALASTLTAVIIFVSGGGVVIATLLGGAGIIAIPSLMHLNNMKHTQKQTSFIEQRDSVENISKENDLDLQNAQVYIINQQETETKQSIPPIKQYDDNLLIQRLITTDALSQQEDILVRIRKKETEERLKENNNQKK